MSSFTENLYLKRAIQKLQEENQQLLKLLSEVKTPSPAAPPPPTAPPSQADSPNKGPWWDPMYGRGGWGVPMLSPYPVTMPLPAKTPAPFTLPANQPFSLNRPYDPNDDPNNFRPTRGMGDGGI